MSKLILILCFLAAAQNVRAQLLYPPKATAPSRSSSEPVRKVDIYVTPYYEAAKSADGQPTVAVHPQFDTLLRSSKQEDILSVRNAVRASPATITPMTLMVLAIRLYDVGLRDESVFWFYAAKDRYLALAQVLAVNSPELAEVDAAMHAFFSLAGPVFNSYAFCDIGKQQQALFAAVDWVEKNPYQAIFMQQLPAKPGNREANLKAALALLRSNAQKEKDCLADPKTVQEINSKRAQNNVPAQFCWK